MARAKKAAPAAPDETPPADTHAPGITLGAPTQIAASAIQPIPFGRLRRAPENVRKTNIDADVESLADDIAAHGLLQSLIGYPWNPDADASTIYIVGGGRRLQALDMLASRGLIDAAFLVPVLVRPKADAIEVSLSENLARRDMNPADEFVAFAALMKPGNLAPADLAKRFGFTERYVKQRLRLSVLADEILDAMREGKMTIDAAMAYAQSQDHKVQLKAFKAQLKAWKPHDPQSIAMAYHSAQLTTSDALFKFVGAEAYEAAGGGYEDDLFGDADRWGGRKLTHGALLPDLARDLLPEAQRQLLAEAIKTHPTTVNVLVPQSIRFGAAPKPPKGFKLVDRGYRYNLPESSALLAKASKRRMEIVRIASLDNGGVLTMESRFFVPAEDHAEIIPPPGQERPEKTPEEIAAERRAKGIRSMAAHLAGVKIREDKLEGRSFWSTTRPELWRTEQFDGVGECYRLTINVYVTPADIDAQMEAAEAQFDADERQRAEQAAEREAAKQGAADAMAVRSAEILAMDPEPAVVLLDRMAFYRWEEGNYSDEREESDLEPEYGFDSLEEALADAEDIGAAYATIADYEAAIAASNGDGDTSPSAEDSTPEQKDLAA
ncbi:hypothetical protein BH10PSE12_BH10PSE12_02920 [soil metagenome]